MQSEQQILEVLKEVLSTVRPGIDLSKVTPETRLADDLAIDSLTMLLMAFSIETKCGVRLNGSNQFVTVGDVCHTVAQLQG